ncbi:MAG: hypothetical protein JXJ22_18570 [Bacteroidales bacterium]|nr:hypothetical protein [Bacteroidales bacterium]
MFGSTALDIVIGLIFIFLLYSLLATVIAEIIATFFGLRARNLSKAISRMLEDDNHKGELTRKFYNHPLIKYLAPGNFFKKPSYISPGNFSKCLLDILKELGKGDAEIEKVKSGLEGMENKAEKLEAIERLLAETELTDSEQMASVKSLMGNKNTHNVLSNTETGGFLKSLLDDAQNDLVKFKSLIEQWYDDTMDRATSWYKSNLQIILVGIGFILAVSFNASTIEIAKMLSKDKNAREQMVQLASSFSENNAGLIANYDSLPAEFQERLDTLLAIKGLVQEDINNAGELLGAGWKLPDSLGVKPIKELNKKGANISCLISDKDTFIIQFPDAQTAKQNKGFYQLVSSGGEPSNSNINIPEDQKVYYASLDKWLYFYKTFLANIWGYILTALAVSLGAPFWFDLLNKLVKVRNSVQELTGQVKKQGPSTTTAPPLNREG